MLTLTRLICPISVANGGFVASILHRCVSVHFETTLAQQNQPDTITLHANYLKRTVAGETALDVRNVRLGGRTSTVHIPVDSANRMISACEYVQANQVLASETDRHASHSSIAMTSKISGQFCVSDPVLTHRYVLEGSKADHSSCLGQPTIL